MRPPPPSTSELSAAAPPSARTTAKAAWTLTALALALVASGCGRKIGDPCETNANCSALGDRFCDISPPGGYCTLEGCDVRMNEADEIIDSCPSEAVCVRFFEARADKSCDPAVEVTKPVAQRTCAPDERCICDCGTAPDDPLRCLPRTMSTLPDGTVAWGCATEGAPGADSAHCAPESTERRWCQRSCDVDTDCRSDEGYECRQTGGGGAVPVPRSVNDAGVPLGEARKFCVPRGTTSAAVM